MLFGLTFRVMDLPIRRRLFVRASNRTVKACSTVSACLSNSAELNLGSRWSSKSRPAAAAAVHVRSQDGWGLSLCMAEVPGFSDIHERSSSPQIDFA